MGKCCAMLVFCLSGLVGGVLAAVPQVEVTREVTGNCSIQAKDGDNMIVDYEGTFKNGTIFDSTFPTNATLNFTLGNPYLVKGWNMGLQGACVGDELRLVIPYTLGYGESGHPPVIPPKTDLYFRIHVHNINPFELLQAPGGVERKTLSGNDTDALNGTANITGNAEDAYDDEYDDDEYDPEGKPSPYDPSDLLYKLQFLAIPVAVILFLLVAYCIYTIEYPDRKIKFYRVRDHDFSSGHDNRVI
ncbi:uncharacterized protein [Asterias amurensis]|uniref:uncharacterized protein n=1 Tax=Asterias amurensis TaxID=7602 RepID=UPI003AB83909